MPRDIAPLAQHVAHTRHTLRCWSDRRAEFMAALDRVGAARRKDFAVEYEARLLHQGLVTIARAAVVAAKVLP